jgi:type 1 fimbria pilin
MKSFKFFVILFLIFGGYCHASCVRVASTVTKTLNFGNVIAQRDAPVGSILATVSLPASNIQLATCTNSGYQNATMVYLGGQTTSLSNVYQTNIPGVGIKGTIWSLVLSVSQYRSYTVDLIDSAASTFSLVKTGNIISGALSGGLAANITYDGSSGDAMDINLTSSNVTQVACSITTPNLSFPIGDILASTFSTTVGTTPTAANNTQNLGLNCDAGANINVSLSGTQNPDVSTTSVLALTGQGSAGVAKGVGVQILYNSTPLILNNRIVLKQSSGGQETFPLTARYYQTKTSVATGSANASATLNLTYQ